MQAVNNPPPSFVQIDQPTFTRSAAIKSLRDSGLRVQALENSATKKVRIFTIAYFATIVALTLSIPVIAGVVTPLAATALFVATTMKLTALVLLLFKPTDYVGRNEQLIQYLNKNSSQVLGGWELEHVVNKICKGYMDKTELSQILPLLDFHQLSAIQNLALLNPKFEELIRPYHTEAHRKWKIILDSKKQASNAGAIINDPLIQRLVATDKAFGAALARNIKYENFPHLENWFRQHNICITHTQQGRFVRHPMANDATPKNALLNAFLTRILNGEHVNWDHFLQLTDRMTAKEKLRQQVNQMGTINQFGVFEPLSEDAKAFVWNRIDEEIATNVSLFEQPNFQDLQDLLRMNPELRKTRAFYEEYLFKTEFQKPGRPAYEYVTQNWDKAVAKSRALSSERIKSLCVEACYFHISQNRDIPLWMARAKAITTPVEYINFLESLEDDQLNLALNEVLSFYLETQDARALAILKRFPKGAILPHIKSYIGLPQELTTYLW